jgi:site-specific recombinase XerD
LAEHLAAYAEGQVEQGYRRHSIGRQIVAISDFSQWLERKQVGLPDLDEGVIGRFLRARHRQQRVRRGDPRALKRLLDMLRAAGIVTSNEPSTAGVWPKEIGDFRQYLLHDRRLSRSTALNYGPVVEQFLSRRFGNKPLDFSALCPSDITGFVVRQASRVSPLRAAMVVTALRSYFRYLHHRGAISVDLAACVPKVPGWSLSALPRFLPARDVERVLNCCDRKTSAGRRNHAILLLLARLGLRACEVVALNLDDIDWPTGQITIYGKGGTSAQLPLPDDVGRALAAYLRDDRPRCSTRRVFVRDRAPLTGLGNSSTVSSLVRRALIDVGIRSRHMGAHVLRHSLATNMLRQGGSLDEIGEVLRHQSPNTTAIYAKVDIDALHSLALPWPGGGR